MNIYTNELWLCKTSFLAAVDNEISCKEAYTVVVVMEPEDLNGENFVRVQPVSKQIEFRTEEDIYIEDETLLGYPFIIETWNEQPMLTRLLDKKLGSVQDLLTDINEPDEYTDEQLDFRKKEIKRTAFLRQSVLSHMAANDSSNKSKKHGIVRTMQLMSFAATIIGAVFLVWQPQKLQPEAYFTKYMVANNYHLDISERQALRGSEIIIEPFTADESEIIEMALNMYKSGDYQTAVSLFQKIPDLDRNETVLLYSAISQMFNAEYSSGVEKLEFIRGRNNSDLMKDVLYYLVISYAAEGKETVARERLKELEEIDPELSERVPGLLKDMRWF